MLKMIRKKREEKAAKLELAAKQEKFLIDCKTDISFLQKMIELVNKDPDLHVQMVLLDGTHLNIWSTATTQQTNKTKFTGVEY